LNYGNRFLQRNGFTGSLEGNKSKLIGQSFTEKKNGVADSTALGSPAPIYCFAKDANSAKVVVEYEIPFCDIHAGFAWEQGLCDSLNADSEEFFKWEHEFVCNLVDKEAKIVYIDSPEDVASEGADEL
ncbi:MAG: hypothetical protein LBB15_01305, partial [Puniceicoccales bacterium]|nr:hypothetical protein [Puniceicoccales bacterium]